MLLNVLLETKAFRLKPKIFLSPTLMLTSRGLRIGCALARFLRRGAKWHYTQNIIIQSKLTMRWRLEIYRSFTIYTGRI